MTIELEPTDPRAMTLLRSAEHYAGALAMVAAATLLGLAVAPRWGTAPVDMFYLPAVLAAAALWGLGPALTAGTVAALSYNFFFTEPVHTFRIDRMTDVFTVVILFLVAVVTSRLAAGMRSHAQLAAAHAARNATIAGFAGRLLSCRGEQEIAQTACSENRRLFDCNTMLLVGLPEPSVVAADPVGNQPTPSDLAAAALSIETGVTAGRGSPRLQPAEWLFHPVRSRTGVVAAFGLARDDGLPPVREEQLPLFSSLLDQMALALERARLEGEARGFAAVRERDRVRASLLSSIAQDMTPRLAAIGEAVRQLKRSGSGDRQLVSDIGGETARLDRFVANLLDAGPEPDEQPIEAGGISIDLLQRSIVKDGEPVHLTPKEFAVLAELAKNRGRVLTHQHLLRVVWGPAQERQIEYLRVAIRSLRQKLERDPSQPTLIVNEPAVGYRLSD
jgi:two-component system sensor histidine kinase KdpD